jgi:hypothetical protein
MGGRAAQLISLVRDQRARGLRSRRRGLRRRSRHHPVGLEVVDGAVDPQPVNGPHPLVVATLGDRDRVDGGRPDPSFSSIRACLASAREQVSAWVHPVAVATEELVKYQSPLVAALR